jgi:adenine/guanine/hypoxanthine permease
MFFAPIAGVVPAAATAPALVIVGYLMMRTLVQGEAEAEHEGGTSRAISAIDFRDLAFGLPAVLTITIMPLTYSITNGIGAGFISYCTVRIAQGKGKQVHWLLYLVSAAFLLYFLAPWLQKRFGL